MTEEDVLRIANNQKTVGIIGIAFQITYCLLNFILFIVRLCHSIQQLASQSIGK